MTKILVICGPTASGKSALALAEAKKRGGEIISADSMQLYRLLPIGTAQPTAAERAEIPHHLVGILELSERADVFDYCRRADAAIADVVRRGKFPIVCGGTGLYLRALVCGLDDLPADPELRAELDTRFDRDDAEEALFAEAEKIDPAALAKWRHCRRKLLRALEVKLICGKSILTLQRQNRSARRYDAEVILLDPAPEALKARIRRRAEIMLNSGWFAECQTAVAAGLLTSPTAHQAIGYREIAAYLAGVFSHAELLERIVTATWQYARRQRTWFRHQPPEPDCIFNEGSF